LPSSVDGIARSDESTPDLSALAILTVVCRPRRIHHGPESLSRTWAESRSPGQGVCAHLDLDSRTAQLCLEGTQAEFERRVDDARGLFLAAWEARTDDYDAAMAAHYVAHLESDPDEALRWHLLALRHAQMDERSAEFMGPLLVSLGGAYEAIGDAAEAKRFFELASHHGVQHVVGEQPAVAHPPDR
jgi:hypothetical protein